MTRNSTTRAVGAALALLVGSAAGLSAQTSPTPPSSTAPTQPDSSRGGIPGGTTGAATGTIGGTPLNTTGTGANTTGTSTGTMAPMNGSTSGSANGTVSRPMSDMQGSTTTSGSMSGSMSGMSMQDSTPRRTRSTTATRRRAATPVRKDATGGMSVQKDVAPAPAPEPAPAPVAVEPPPPPPPPAPEPAPVPAPAPEPVVTTTTMTTTIPVAPERKLGNGFYFGVQGGANFPQNNIRDAYRTGFNGGIQLGYDPESSPIGLRVNALYNRFRGDNTNSLAVQPNRASDSETYSAFADAVLRLPFGKFLGATSGFYLVGGPGVTLFRNYRDFQRQTGVPVGQQVTGSGSGSNTTRFSLNGGAGLEYGIGRVSLFTEGRYVRIFTQNQDTDYLPVTVGLRFHR